MSQTVTQALANHSGFLEKLASNEPLSNLVMGFLGSIILTCAKRGKSVAAVRCSNPTESLGDFRFKMTFATLLVPSTQIWSAQSTMKDYVAAKSASMARCFDVNPSLSKTFQMLVETIDRYCQHKRIPFQDYKIKKAYVTKDDVFVIRSGGVSLDSWKGKGNY